MYESKVIKNYPKSGEYFDGTDLSLIAGFNQQISAIKGFKVDLDSRFSWGLSDIRSVRSDQNIKNYGFSVGIVVKKNAKKTLI